MIVPFPAGTAVDVVARFLATRLTQQWNQSVYVENRVGADGLIGTVAARMAPADGHTILYTGPPFLFVPDLNPQADYDPLEGFSAGRTRDRAGLHAGGDQERALQHLPGDGGNGKAHRRPAGCRHCRRARHRHGRGMARAAGVDINIINYKTTAQLISDSIAGHVPMVLSALGSLNTLTHNGSLKALAVSGPQRSIIAPEVPTAMEAGAKDFSVVSWNGAFVRTGTRTRP